MPNDFSTEYAERSDDELLHLASQRSSLTDEAAASLDRELRRRNLSDIDAKKYERATHRLDRRENMVRRRKIFGKYQLSGKELLTYFALLILVMSGYFALPRRFHLSPAWEEAADCVMVVFLLIVVGWRHLWNDFGYWISLISSSVLQLLLVHSWAQKVGVISRSFGKAGAFLGLVFFAALYGGVRYLRRSIYGDSANIGN